MKPVRLMLVEARKRSWVIEVFAFMVLKVGLLYLYHEVNVLNHEVGQMAEVTNFPKTKGSDSDQSFPTQIAFCGRVISFNNPELRERVEQEFYSYLAGRELLILVAKRTGKYFPLIASKLAEANLPDDLKFIAVVESWLNPRAVSRKQAVGIWQLRRETARGLKLKVNRWVDERLDPALSTEAAIKLLQQLFERFNDWPLALAAYNWRPAEVSRSLETQAETDYFRLSLTDETERYLPRILAIKIIFSNPENYGVDLDQSDFYQAAAFDEVSIRINHWLRVREIAQAANSSYREIKVLNPWIKKDRLPPGKYRLHLPPSQKEVFSVNFKGLVIDN